MLAKRIIPCLDVKDGKVVKGRNFQSMEYAGEPAALALKYAREGADELVFLDITASVEKRKANRIWIKETAQQLNIPFTVGGGISSIEDIREVLALGADKVSINTAALNNPLLIKEASGIFGAQCIVVAIDAKRAGGKWELFSYAGTTATGKDAITWATECQRNGAGEILITSIDRDGTKDGFDTELICRMTKMLNIPVIASGGAGALSDFFVVFKMGNADAALAAGVFHYGDISIRQLKEYLSQNNILVRIE